VIGVGAGGRVITDAARGPEVHLATDAADALRAVTELIAPGDAVLVKASRAVGLEIVADRLLAERGSIVPQKAVPS
jgi:UDP-N-acetylmuramyl pentapeptide synthase